MITIENKTYHKTYLQVQKYIKNQGYVFKNITNQFLSPTSVVETYKAISQLAIKNKKIVYFFERNPITAPLFLEYDKKVIFYFINNDNFLTIHVGPKLTTKNKHSIDKFLQDDLTCSICKKASTLSLSCKCTVLICDPCVLTLLEQSSRKKENLFQCQTCRDWIQIQIVIPK